MWNGKWINLAIGGEKTWEKKVANGWNGERKLKEVLVVEGGRKLSRAR